MNRGVNIKSELSSYSNWMRKVEIISLVLFAILFFNLNVIFFASPHAETKKVLICLAVAYLLSDFISGLVHWFADTWGSYRWPVIGNSLIRSFREHHVDPVAMTDHDFIEVNGATALLSLPLLLFCFFIGFNQTSEFYFSGIATWLCLFTILTGEIHKWSHQERPSAIVRQLQHYRLILSPAHHSRHHHGNIDTHYCMTTGWLNPLLNQIGFFRILETMIHKLTGAIPRSDDSQVLAEARQNPTHA